MNRYLYLFVGFIFFQLTSFGQIEEHQIDTSYKQKIPIVTLPQNGPLKNIYFISNMRFAFENNFDKGNYTGSRFRMQEWRPEILGQVYPGVSFRVRLSLFPNPQTSSTDNLKRNIDFLSVSVKMSPKLYLTLGKMISEWGGYEIDQNPINLYLFNDIVNFSDLFLTGAKLDYKASANHTISAQVLNANTRTFNEMYGTIPGVTASKFPLAFLTQWRGTFAGGKFQTLYSYNLFTQAKGKHVNMFTLGHQVKLSKWKIQYDFKYSNEELDRTSVVSSIISSANNYSAIDARYIEHWMFLERTISPRLKINAALMLSDAYWYGNPDPNSDAHLRSAWGIVPSIEFNPFTDLNMRFFCSYVGRFFRYSEYSKTAFNSKDGSTARIQVGFISPLRIF